MSEIPEVSEGLLLDEVKQSRIRQVFWTIDSR